MTKEELIYEVLSCVNTSSDVTCEILLNEFFETNVVIPKGENRHPYADVLHEWIEGAEIEVHDTTMEFNEFINCRSAEHVMRWEYRIKPKEPVYEWQWVYIKADSTAGITEFFTEEKAKECHQWIKIEETKRERRK